MRQIHYLSLILMTAMALFTWNSIAMPIDARAVAQPLKMHILENLDQASATQAKKILSKKGYQLSYRPLFSESNRAVIITRKLADEYETASIQIELVKMEGKNTLPKTIFITKVENDHLEEALAQLPKSEDLVELIQETPAMAFQDTH